MPAGLTIVQVTPHVWEDEHDVNRHVRGVARELAGRGHRVAILAPSRSPDAVRATRAALRDGGELLGPAGAEPSVLAVGEALPEFGATRRGAALPIDVTRTVEEALEALAPDIVHVHEPFAPSTSSAALRTSRALNVGTFHAPVERLVATQVARKVVGLVLGRLDARIAAHTATAQLMQRHFPAEYRVLATGADVAEGRETGAGPLRIAYVDGEGRGALRLFLRALRRLGTDADWTATVISGHGPSSSIPLRPELRERVHFATPQELDEDALLRGADVIVGASDGTAPAPGILVRAIATGAVPVASRIPVYEEITREGEAGLHFELRDAETLGAQLGRLATDPSLLQGLRERGEPLRRSLSFAAAAGGLEGVYRELTARRHDTAGNPAVRARLAGRRLIDVDLHMHTDHSPDCATPVEVLLATAREQGLGAIAITDHNLISGALAAREIAREFGVKVIIAEEVKTASQGEVIGLFLSELIPRGLTLAETIAGIKRQGGLVYVPHPFDRMHSVPDYEHLLAILPDIDAIEIYNPRVAIGSFNEEAERFAAKYRIVRGAGSDSHVAQGLGSVRIRMRDFDQDSPEEFLESLRGAEITTKPGTLLYVQALKFLETTAIPASARRARKERRVRRATGG